MPGEIRVSLQFNVSKGGYSDNFTLFDGIYDQAGIGGGNPGTITVGTTESSLTFTQLTTAGWVIMKNLDPTNYIQWGFATNVYGGRIRPLGFVIFQAEPGLTLFLKANTAACKLQVKCYEN